MLLHRRQGDASCLLTSWQHFFVGNDVMKLRRHIENSDPF